MHDHQGAHQGGRHDQEQQAAAEGEQGVEPGVRPQMGVGHPIKRFHSGNGRRQKQRIGADGDFDLAVERQQRGTLRPAVDDAAGRKAAQGQAAHEHREHRGHRKRGAADDLVDHAHPYGLIDEPRHPGNKETAQHRGRDGAARRPAGYGRRPGRLKRTRCDVDSPSHGIDVTRSAGAGAASASRRSVR